MNIKQLSLTVFDARSAFVSAVESASGDRKKIPHRDRLALAYSDSLDALSAAVDAARDEARALLYPPEPEAPAAPPESEPQQPCSRWQATADAFGEPVLIFDRRPSVLFGVETCSEYAVAESRADAWEKVESNRIKRVEPANGK